MPRREDAARRTALGGILCAGSLLFLFGACVAPSGRIGLCAVSGLFPALGGFAYGGAFGCLCWGAAGLLGLILLPDKGISLLFLLFLGIYPLLKGVWERVPRLFGWVCKFVYFNAVFIFYYYVLESTLVTGFSGLMAQAPVLLLAGNVVFLLYDLGLTKLLGSVAERIKPWFLSGQGRKS